MHFIAPPRYTRSPAERGVPDSRSIQTEDQDRQVFWGSGFLLPWVGNGAQLTHRPQQVVAGPLRYHLTTINLGLTPTRALHLASRYAPS